MIDFININSTEDQAIQISVTDSKGNLVLQMNSEKQHTRINFTEYSPGPYNMVLINSKGEQIKSFKVIKK